MLLPRVSEICALMVTSLAAHMDTLPSVVVSAASKFRLRPAFSRTLPLTVVMAALTLASRPQQTTKLPLVADMGALTLTSLAAFSVSVVVLGVAVQLMAWLIWMSPLPLVAVFRVVTGGVPATVASGPMAVLMTTLLVTSNAESVGPLMLSVAPLPTVKSCGSISQVPVVPRAAAVVIFAPLAMETRAADVSMNPPWPVLGALASNVPPT